MIAITGGKVLTVTGDVLENAVVLVDDGRFTSVGPGEVPPGAEIIDAAGKYVVPGMVDAHTHIGLEDFGETTSPVTPHVRILDSIKLGALGFEDALLAGITTVIITPGSSNVISGTSLVMKTAGPNLPTRILRDPAGMKMAWRKGTNKPSRDVPYPMSLMGIAGVLRNALVETRNYMARRERDEVPQDPVKELMAQVLRRELPIRFHSFTPVEIQAILRLQDEFGFYFTVEHGFEAHFIADELARRGVPVVYGPTPGLRRHKMFPYRGPHGAAILHHAGVKVALQTDHPDTSIKQLRVYGALLLRYTDLTPAEVMRMLTINGAEIAGVGERVGSIEPGKDADFAIYSDHPLKVQSRVEHVYINGVPVVVNGQVVVDPYGWAAEKPRAAGAILSGCDGGAMRFTDRVAIVTGAGNGIGLAIAHAFAAEGACAVIADINAESGARAVEEIQSLGGRALSVPTDVSDEAQVERMVREVVDQVGRIDILVNNAGVVVHKSLVDTDLRSWQRQLDVQLTGPFLTTKHVGRHMMHARKAGRPDRQHLVGVGHHGARQGRCALRKQGWADHADQGRCDGAGAVRGHGQRGRAGTYRRAIPARGGEHLDGLQDPLPGGGAVGPHGRAVRHCPHGALPVLRRCCLDHRPAPPRRRRPDVRPLLFPGQP